MKALKLILVIFFMGNFLSGCQGEDQKKIIWKTSIKNDKFADLSVISAYSVIVDEDNPKFSAQTTFECAKNSKLLNIKLVVFENNNPLELDLSRYNTAEIWSRVGERRFINKVSTRVANSVEFSVVPAGYKIEIIGGVYWGPITNDLLSDNDWHIKLQSLFGNPVFTIKLNDKNLLKVFDHCGVSLKLNESK